MARHSGKFRNTSRDGLRPDSAKLQSSDLADPAVEYRAVTIKKATASALHNADYADSDRADNNGKTMFSKRRIAAPLVLSL